jgi:uncharacterized protein YwqG
VTVARPQPLAFIAQLDLAELSRAGALDADFPQSGRLAIFYDTIEQPWGFRPADQAGSAVLYHEADAALTRREPPAELTALARFTPFAPRACRAHPCLAPVPMASAAFAAAGFSATVEDAYDAWWSDDEAETAGGGVDWMCHRVGGWPTPIQGDMQTECALVAAGYDCGTPDPYRTAETADVRASAHDWLLLAQIGSDPAAGMTWGDNGQLYVWIRRADLRDRRFAPARIILQCH